MLIRTATVADAAGIDAIYNEAILTTAVTFDVAVWESGRRSEWLADRCGDGARWQCLVLVDDVDVDVDVDVETNAIVGFASTSALRPKAAFDCSVETSIYLDSGVQGLGWGRRLYVALLAGLPASVRRAYAAITLPNRASVGLHESLGFRAAGVWDGCGAKFGAAHSVGWWEWRRDDDAGPGGQQGG